MADKQDEQKDERHGAIEEQVKGVSKDESVRRRFVELIGRLESDDEALIVLKGHLVIEERITSAIEKFVFHPEQLDKARLTFGQKLVVRSKNSTEGNRVRWQAMRNSRCLRQLAAL